MNRRKFIKRGALFVPAIFVPRLLRAGGFDVDDPAFLAQQKATSGAPPASFTEFVTGSPSAATRNDGTYVVGFAMTTGGSPVTAKSISRWCIAGNSQTHRVGIFDISGNLLAFVTINSALGTPGTFQQVSLGTPLVLTASTTYAIMSEEFLSGDSWYDSYVVANTGIGGAVIVQTAYSLTAWGTSLPFSGSGSGQGYVPVSFGY